MTIASILFPADSTTTRSGVGRTPDFFRDLNLDRFEHDLAAGREAYELAEFYRVAAPTVDVARQRQNVFRDLEDPDLFASMVTFAADIHEIIDTLARASKLRCPLQRQEIILQCAENYCNTIALFSSLLESSDISSQLMKSLRSTLRGYRKSENFETILHEASEIRSALRSLRYTMLMWGDGIVVRPYAGEVDYGAEVEHSFAKFQQDLEHEYVFKFTNYFELNHIEANLLQLVERTFPAEFSRLSHFCSEHGDFLEPGIVRCAREMQFYFSYLDYIAPLRRAGLPFCFPEFTANKSIMAEEMFELVLARDVVAAGTRIITNEFHLSGCERVIVVSGANQGGKTTFARTLGQLCHLARLGLPVPGRSARLLFVDAIHTHFERSENVRDLHGKLEDDLLRIHAILTQTSEHSVVILNEIFNSTTSTDAEFLGRQIISALIEREALVVCVTFLDELSRLGPETVSYVATVKDDDPSMRTLKVVRRPADGLSHATTLAAKYGLTYSRVKERLTR